MLHEWVGNWGEPVDPDKLVGSPARQFLRYLKTDNAMGLASVVGARSHDGAELILIEVETNRPQRPACAIERREPVGVYFTADGRPSVLALRADFPDTLHQNWMPEGHPASLCVDDRPWQEAKPTYTPAELLHRLLKWFERAGLGQLQDARQPVDPVFCGEGLDVVFPREIFEPSAGADIEFVGRSHNPSNPVVITVVRPDPRERPGQRRAGHVFVVYRSEPKLMERIKRAPTTLASLARELEPRGVDLFSDLTAKVGVWSRAQGDKSDRFNSYLGILLQMPITSPGGAATGTVDEVAFLTPTTVGDIGVALGVLSKSPLSNGPKYSFLITPAPLDRETIAKIPVMVARAHVEFDRRRAVQLAGRESDKPRKIVLVGAGAIGSLTAEPLVREGLGENWTVIDKDILLPHNMARHTLTPFDVELPKAISLANRLKALRSDASAEAIVADVTNAGPHEEAVSRALKEADLVIDAAASVPVARFLSDHEGGARRASIFFNPAGTAVVLLLEDAGRDADLRSLEAAYYGEILRTDSLSSHLLESSGSIPYAGACRAVTNRIPASRAQTLSGIVANAMSGALDSCESLAKIWTILSDGSVKAHPVAVGEITTVNALGWKITISQTLLSKIRAMRAEKLPVETGGVLFGTIDLLKLRIDLVEAWPQPPGSKGTIVGFTRGTRGLKTVVEVAISKTLDQIRYVGEWHSHPRRSSTRPSDIDLNQIVDLTDTLAVDECPALMVIVGDNSVSVNLAESLTSEGTNA